ncbi:AAA family ATPase [Bradyrhizobium sp. AZCC 2289]|uniref:AAA family ATPase n=1 Tax=Bradyrhizobium sp. AZCC 2289 TaxID=3117026 RepID=UPI002FF28A0F
MNELLSYVFSPLREGDISLYRGSGNDLAPILLVAAEETSLGCVARLENEYALKADLDADWAARPIALTHYDDRMTLVLDDPGGTPVDRLLGQPLDVSHFLRIAISLAGALCRVHERGLIHKDIKPANILFDAASGGVWLTGFGIASRLPREHQAPAPPEVIAGTLAYMAPEQTGRMNRSVDSRSDLYALGVTFYEMLTGQLPFTAADPMGWVHCHIARQAVPPDERVAGIPQPLSAIVMKLLAKTAEARYQTAAGVEADLRRSLVEWESHGRIDPFLLGVCDVSDRLLIPEKLYGREREIDALLACFDRVVVRGTPEFVLVSGYSGIGKSSVVNELHKALVPSRGLFASGKFDQFQRGIPYATLGQAFRSLVRSLLSQSEAELGGWRGSLNEALGPNGQLVVNLVPELEVVIGKQPPVPDLPPQEAQNRFQMVFRRFLGVFARKEHRLALFLDDLQWLDAATLDLLQHLVTHSEVRHLLLVGAYRDNEVGPAHPLKRMLATIADARSEIKELQLGPLASEDVGRLAAETLHAEPEVVQPLAELMFAKTGGNPFFTIQFLNSLVDEALIAFEPDTLAWHWDLDRIRAKGITDNVADLMAGRLGRLPTGALQIIKCLSCLGNSAQTLKLEMVTGQPEGEIHAALLEPVRTGLIFRLDGGYAFAHDRVREAAYALISEGERAASHLHIARVLVTRTPSQELEEKVFEIVNQFNRATALIGTVEEREQIAELDLIAGKRARSSMAYVSALTYLAAGCALLAKDSWERRHNLAFALAFHRAECEFLTGDLAAAEEGLLQLWARAESVVDKASVTRLRLDLYTTLHRSDRAVEICLDYLHSVDINWSPHPTSSEVQLEYERMWRKLGTRSIEDLADLPPIEDPVCRATLDVLTSLQAPARFTDQNLPRLLAGRMANLSLEHGNSDATSLGYVWVGQLLTRLGEFEAGYRFGRLGLNLVDERGLDRFKARVYLVFGHSISPWNDQLRISVEWLRRAFDTGEQTGDLTFAAYASNSLITLRLAAGDTLADVQREADSALAFVRKSGFGLVADMMTGSLRLIRTLRGVTAELGSFDDGEFDESRFEHHLEASSRSAIAVCWYWIRKLQARFHAGDWADAAAAASKAEKLLWTSQSNFEEAEYHFYGALARAAHFGAAPAEDRPRHLLVLLAHHRQLARWAENCPKNFESRAALVGAEIARIEDRQLDAERLYEDAIRSSGVNGLVHEEGLAHEVAARFYAARGFEAIAHLYLRNARNCYLRWGAHGKVRQLDRLYPRLAVPEGQPATATIGSAVQELDIASVVKSSQAVSGEMVLSELIKTLLRIAVEHAGAERGLLILFQSDEPRTVAEATSGRSHVEVTLREAAVSPAELPLSVLHYVARTRESVILDDALAQNPFSEDEYICQKRPRSVLCLPLIKQAKLIGVLHLENTLASHVFTPARISVLELLASQAAISLENACLYNDLQEREARIRRLVDSNIIGIIIWDFQGRIIEANQAFLDMLGYSREDLMSGRLRWTELTPAEWRDADERAGAELKAAGTVQPREKEYFRKDGSRVPVLLGATTFGDGQDAGVAFVLDLTERKRTESALQRSQAYLTQAQRLSHTSSWAWDVRLQEFVYRSPEVYHLFGFDPEKDPLSPQSFQDRILPEDRDLVIEMARQAIQEKGDFEVDFRIDLPDGPTRYVHSVGHPLVGDDGEVLELVGTHIDVTEQHLAKEELQKAFDEIKKSEDRLRLVIDTIPTLVWRAGPEGSPDFLNQPALDYTGLSLDQAETGWPRAFHPEDKKGMLVKWSAIRESGMPGGLEARLRRFDGEYRWFWFQAVPLRDESGNIVKWYGSSTDIEDRKRAEEKLHKAQTELAHVMRVTMLGELTASIAHEVNQPLAAIIANADACLRWLDRETPDLPAARRSVEWVINDGDRASEVIQRVRALAKQSDIEKVPLDVNDVVREVIALVQRELSSHRVSLRTELAPALPALLGDRVQLQQVVINLMMNGIEAMQPIMDRPRELVIRTGRDEARRVFVSVTDCGVGISAENADRLFNAFFTTKSGGMGMGLSICRSIVEAHGGRLSATEALPHGATFQLALPVNADAAS